MASLSDPQTWIRLTTLTLIELLVEMLNIHARSEKKPVELRQAY